MNKGNIGSFILAMLFLAALVIGTTLFISGVPSTYSVNETNLDNTSYYAKAQEVEEMAGGMKDRIERINILGIDIDVSQTPLVVVTGAIEAIRMAFSSMDLFVTMIGDLVEATGLEIDWFQSLLVAGAMILIVLLIIGTLYRYPLATWGRT